RIIAYLAKRFHFDDRIVYCKATDAHKIAQLISAEMPAAVNDYDRLKNALVASWTYWHTIWGAASRDNQNPEELACLIKFIPLGARLLLASPGPVDLRDLLFLTQLDHPRCAQLVNSTADPEARYSWRHLMTLHTNKNWNQLEREFGSSQRLLMRVLNIIFLAH